MPRTLEFEKTGENKYGVNDELRNARGGRLAGWQAGRLAGWQAGRLCRLCRLAGWQAGRLCMLRGLRSVRRQNRQLRPSRKVGSQAAR